MKLKAKFGRNHYKTNESYLNAVYRNNKTLINEYLGDIAEQGGVSPLRQFKKLVYENQSSLKRKGKTATITRALNTFTSSADFIPEDKFYEIHFRENAVKGIKKFGGIKTLHNLTKKKFDPNKLKYIGDNSYEYRGYVLKFGDSPKKLSIFKGRTGTVAKAELFSKPYKNVI